MFHVLLSQFVQISTPESFQRAFFFSPFSIFPSFFSFLLHSLKSLGATPVKGLSSPHHRFFHARKPGILPGLAADEAVQLAQGRGRQLRAT